MAEVTDDDRQRAEAWINTWAPSAMEWRSNVDSLAAEFAAVREQALASKIGPDWREALPYETEIELSTEITRLREQLTVALARLAASAEEGT